MTSGAASASRRAAGARRRRRRVGVAGRQTRPAGRPGRASRAPRPSRWSCVAVARRRRRPRTTPRAPASSRRRRTSSVTDAGPVGRAVHGAPGRRARRAASPACRRAAPGRQVEVDRPGHGPSASAQRPGGQRPPPVPRAAVGRDAGVVEPAHGRARRGGSGRWPGARRRPGARAGGRPCTTSSGTPARSASTTAACSSAAAVPLVVSTTAGRPLARPEPEGQEPGAALVLVRRGPAMPGVGGQRQGQRRRAGARGDHGVA